MHLLGACLVHFNRIIGCHSRITQAIRQGINLDAGHGIYLNKQYANTKSKYDTIVTQ